MGDFGGPAGRDGCRTGRYRTQEGCEQLSESTADDAGTGSDPIRQEPDYRFTLANERTFLAWQRTALGLLAAAVAVIQFLPELGVPEGRHILGLVLAVLAIATAGVGLWRWQQVEEAMRTGTRLPRHPTPGYLAVGLGGVGVLVLIVTVVEWVTG